MKIGPKYKIARRLGAQIFDKTKNPKFAAKEANKTRRSDGGRPRGLTDYGIQMREKQKVRFFYGISEKQFANYVKKIITAKGIGQDEELYKLLEIRLDNAVYRIGLVASRRAARQMVSHGHILVNGVKVTIPSFSLKKGDEISIRNGSARSVLFANIEEKLKEHTPPVWLSFDGAKKQGKVIGLPKLDFTQAFLDFPAVLDFYKR